MARKETSFLGSIFNALTGTGETVRKTTDFWGNRRTIVHNHSTGTTREYTRKKGFFSDYTEVKVKRNGERIASGRIKKKDYLLFERVKHEYEGKCFCCNGTGVHRSGNTCRKCGGTGVFRKTYYQ